MDVFKRLEFITLFFLIIFPTHLIGAEVFTSSTSAEVISLSGIGPKGEEPPAQVSYRDYKNDVEQSELSMFDAVHRAVGWHPLIAESIGNLYRQRQGVKAARSAYYPQLSAGIIAGQDTEYKREGDGHAIQLNVSQLLFDFGKVSSNVNRAKASVRRSQAQVLQSIDEVARQTAKATVEVQRYQALLQSSEEQIEGVSSITHLVQIRKERGASSRSDVLQAQSRMAAAQASKQRIEALLSRWRSTLQNLTGLQSPLRVSMAVPEDVAQACDGQSFDLSAVPEVLIAEASRAEAMAQLDESKANAWPTFSLDANVNQYLDQAYVDANVFDEQESSVFINVSMPIYQGGRISAGKEGAGYALLSADAAKDTAQLQTVQKYREAQEEAEGLMRSLGTLSSRESAIAETRDLYKQQYSILGTRTLIDLLNAEQELHLARIEKNNTIYDLHLLKIDCLYSRSGFRNAFSLNGRQIQGVEVLP
ncbi:TolC family outer membrane protein [Microbulbifer epialgicus]|uniref:TolC family outer membrane protein n=1 Tax=Microbulbifer epialgicus TaxID=393907 RepID=A0ABV4P3D0_9GAMM